MVSLGGLAYTVAVLSSVAGNELEIWPVSRVGDDLRRRLRDWLQALPGVRLGGLVDHPGPSPRVELRYEPSGAERRERLLDPVPPLRAEELSAIPSGDLVLANCITGDDCTPGAAHRLSRGGARAYLDVHSLALGRADDGTRFPRPPSRGREWLDWADTVQCNRTEAAILAGLEWPGATDEELAEAAAGWGRGDLGPRVVAITRGADGAMLIEVGGSGSRITALDAPPVDVVDPTGAGDAFGAAFCAARLLGSNPVEAARRATATAATTTKVRGSEAIVETADAVRRAWEREG